MSNYNVTVSYDERSHDTLTISADSPEQAEFDALNEVRDGNPDASNVLIVETVEIE